MNIEYVALNAFVFLISMADNLNMTQHQPMRNVIFSRKHNVLHQSVMKMSVDFVVDLQKETAFETCYYRHTVAANIVFSYRHCTQAEQ